MIKAQGISKKLQDAEILRSMDIEFGERELVVLIGANGSGKSTLLRCLSLLDPPDSGTIEIDGKSWLFDNGHTEAPIDIWPRVTVVFQQLFLWPHLTARQNIELGLRCDGGDLDTSERLISKFDMHEFVNRYPNEMSLGQRQRVAIVRALSLQPKYLLLDEVTSALDVQQVNFLLSELEQLVREGTGVLLVTHMMGFARRAADQVLFLNDGTIEDRGGPELLSAPKSPALRELLSLHEGSSV